MSQPISAVATALGHVRNATLELFRSTDLSTIALGLECLDLEAVLNWNDIDPAVVPQAHSARDDLSAAKRHLARSPDQVPPAAWPILESLLRQLD